MVVSVGRLRVALRHATGAPAELIVRAHGEGVAFRYHLLGDGESVVADETTGFAIPGGARVGRGVGKASCRLG